MILAPIELEHVQHVARNMRDSDRREVFATRFVEDVEEVATSAMHFPHFAWTAGTPEDGPIAALGGVPLWPGVWAVWMYATPLIGKIGLQLTKAVKRSILPAMMGPDFRRAECHSIEGHDFAHRWLEVLGFSYETRLRGYGKGGETFHVFSIIQPPKL